MKADEKLCENRSSDKWEFFIMGMNTKRFPINRDLNTFGHCVGQKYVISPSADMQACETHQENLPVHWSSVFICQTGSFMENRINWTSMRDCFAQTFQK